MCSSVSLWCSEATNSASPNLCLSGDSVALTEAVCRSLGVSGAAGTLYCTVPQSSHQIIPFAVASIRDVICVTIDDSVFCDMGTAPHR